MPNIAKIIRTIILAMSAILAFIVVGLLALPFIISPDTLRDHAVKTLSASTGRVITIGGPVDFHVFPNISLSFEDFSMSQLASLNAKLPMLHMQKATATLKLLPLFSGTAEFDNVDITGLTIHAVNKATGQAPAAVSCNIAAQGHAHYDMALGFTPEAIKRGVTSETKLSVTDIVLLDKDLVNQLAQTFGGSNWQKFESLTATITTQDGIVHSDDIKLTSANFNGTGITTVNLITEALSGEAKLNVSGLTLPVYVKGTLSKPKYGVATGDAVNALFQGLGLTTGTNGGTSSGTQSDSKSSTSQKALDGLGTLINKIGQ